MTIGRAEHRGANILLHASVNLQNGETFARRTFSGSGILSSKLPLPREKSTDHISETFV